MTNILTSSQIDSLKQAIAREIISSHEEYGLGDLPGAFDAAETLVNTWIKENMITETETLEPCFPC